jgi:hypothetical protein
MRRTLLLVLACAGLSACATVRSEHVLTGAPGPAYGGPVAISMEGAALPGRFEEVAIVTAMGTHHLAELPSVMAALQGEAALLGCNAVVRVRYDRGAASASATGVAGRAW